MLLGRVGLGVEEAAGAVELVAVGPGPGLAAPVVVAPLARLALAAAELGGEAAAVDGAVGGERGAGERG